MSKQKSKGLNITEENSKEFERKLKQVYNEMKSGKTNNQDKIMKKLGEAFGVVKKDMNYERNLKPYFGEGMTDEIKGNIKDWLPENLILKSIEPLKVFDKHLCRTNSTELARMLLMKVCFHFPNHSRYKFVRDFDVQLNIKNDLYDMAILTDSELKLLLDPKVDIVFAMSSVSIEKLQVFHS